MSKKTASNVVGRAIRARRNRLGMTLRQVSRLTNVTEAHISRIERGDSGATIDVLDGICSVLDIDLSRLRGLRMYRKRQGVAPND